MVEYEFMFGDAWCVITISTDVDAGGASTFTARPYVLGHRGRSSQAVGDRDGRPLIFTSDSAASVLAHVSEYMEERFGPRRVAPAPTTSYVTSYAPGELAEGPPLADERPDPIVVLALDRILRGDEVIVTGQGAKLARQPLSAMSAGAFLATAAEDIEKGQHGRVRQIQEDMGHE